MIKIRCSGCGKTIKAGDDWAGKRGKCPNCGADFSVPHVAKVVEPKQLVGVDTNAPAATDLGWNFVEAPAASAPPHATIEHRHKASGGAFRTGFGLAFGCLAAVGLTFGGCLVVGAVLSSSTKNTLQNINQQVAADAVQQYEIAKRDGSAMDAYVQSGFVVAAFLQAKDDANYQKWKKIQAAEARRAGMPQF